MAHFEHEEAEIEAFYLANPETAPLKAMDRAIGKVSRPRAGRFFAWVLDGASPNERAAVTRDVPGPILSIIGGIFGRGYHKNIAPVWKGVARLGDQRRLLTGKSSQPGVRESMRPASSLPSSRVGTSCSALISSASTQQQ